MKVLGHQGYEIDRCPNCKGLWFDRLEHEELKLADNPEVLDIGDPGIGRQFNRMEKVDCPHCKTAMSRVEAGRPKDVWYDVCPACRGVFFDAGEFKDYLRSDSVISFKSPDPKNKK